MERYNIYTRYEYWKSGPEKIFTEWIQTEYDEFSSTEADEKIKELKKNFADIDKKTKLNHEYKKVLVEN